MDILQYLSLSNWSVVDTLSIPPSAGQYCTVEDLNLSEYSRKYLQTYSNGIYLHQRETIELSLRGQNVCMVTGTASGKTLTFHVMAIEHLAKDPLAKIVAIYPMKALGREQEKRWTNALTQAGMKAKVGRIDGNVPPKNRIHVLTSSQIIVVTPDIIHAWLLSNLSNENVKDFLRHISLIVIDEVHTYSGVFGSNAAFLFRRLQHLMSVLGAFPQYICASATIAEPQNHLKKLLGVEFSVVGKDKDSSPKQQVDIHLANPPGQSDFLSEVVKLLSHLSHQTGKRFITFVDSRKQVELITSIIQREGQEGDDADNIEDHWVQATPPKTMSESAENGDEQVFAFDEIINVLETIDVLPYRAGYEEADRAKIQERLTEGKLNGIVSTSALELGIDIPYLEVCILVGVPPSSTSLHQRIGRIGRRSKGDVIVINSGDVYDQAVFSNPKSLVERPMAESTLYLENSYIQYIHALCLARLGGEHDQLSPNDDESSFFSPVSWDGEFIHLCNQERSGQLPKEFQSMKLEAGDNPNYTFPLRDVQSQFKVVLKQGGMTESLGSLSYGQLMREAYPGAVYYYATMPYRVTRISVVSRTIEVRKEKRYTTKPQALPIMIFPNVSQENVFQGFYQGDLICFESNLQVRESINGIRERRGRAENMFSYPLPASLGVGSNLSLFTRNYFTTGVVITHPVLNREGVDSHLIASLIYESFLMLVPLERQDVNNSSDRFRLEFKPIKEGCKFIAIFDQTYGSLRLTSRIMEPGLLNKIFLQTQQLIDEQKLLEVNELTRCALDELIRETQKPRRSLVFTGNEILQTNTNAVRVILPKSKGLLLTMGNEEFYVERVFFSPDGLRYEGKVSQIKDSLQGATLLPLVEHVIEIPGESQVGLYHFETGMIEEIRINQTKLPLIEVPREAVDTRKLRLVLENYFDYSEMMELCEAIGVSEKILGDGNNSEKANNLVSFAEKLGYVNLLLQKAFLLYTQRKS
mgnify:CR=1 FL=1